VAFGFAVPRPYVWLLIAAEVGAAVWFVTAGIYLAAGFFALAAAGAYVRSKPQP
jgi:hypothetical protein